MINHELLQLLLKMDHLWTQLKVVSYQCTLHGKEGRLF